MRTVLIAVVLLFTVPASADIPPVNACPKVGDACDTAGADYKSRGVCAKQTCSRTLPGPNGPETHSYDCNLCVAAPPAEPTTQKASACSVADGFARDGAGAGAALLFLAAALAAVRRR